MFCLILLLFKCVRFLLSRPTVYSLTFQRAERLLNIFLLTGWRCCNKLSNKGLLFEHFRWFYIDFVRLLRQQRLGFDPLTLRCSAGHHNDRRSQLAGRRDESSLIWSNVYAVGGLFQISVRMGKTEMPPPSFHISQHGFLKHRISILKFLFWCHPLGQSYKQNSPQH